MTIIIDIDAHTEDSEGDEPTTDWPAATLNPNPGDWILANLGTEYVYATTDDQTGVPAVTITFGAVNNLDGTFTNAPTQGPSVSNPPASTMGTTTPWSTQPSDVANNYSSYSGPYASISPSQALDLGHELIDWGVEVFGTIDANPDPHTGKYKVHMRSGTSELQGGDHADNSIGRTHLHGHNQIKHNWHGVIFSTNHSQIVTGLTGGTLNVSWTNGYFKTHDGKSLTLPGPSDNGLPAYADSYVVFNPTSSSVVVTSWPVVNGVPDTSGASGPSITDTISAYNSVYDTSSYCGFGTIRTLVVYNGVWTEYSSDLGQDTTIPLVIVGRVSHNMDLTGGSGNYWIQGWHTGAHQIHKAHLAFNVSGPQAGQYYYQPNHPGDFMLQGVVMTPETTGTSNVTFDWPNPDGTITPKVTWMQPNGSGGYTKEDLGIGNPITNGKQSMVVNAGDLIGYNSDSVAHHGINPLCIGKLVGASGVWQTSDGVIDSTVWLIGRVSETTCVNNNKLWIYGFHVGLHQISCRQLQDGTVGRQQQHGHSKFLLHGVVMRIAPGNEEAYRGIVGNVPVSWDTGGAVTVVDNSAGPFTIANLSMNINAGDYIVFNSSANTISGVPSMSIADVSPSILMDPAFYIIGRVSPNVDKKSGLLYIQGWHVGLHQISGDQLGYGSADRYNLRSHNVGKFHLNNVTIHMGTNNVATPVLAASINALVNVPMAWASGGTLSIDNGTTFPINNTTINVSQDTWIAYNSSSSTVNGIAANTIGTVSPPPAPNKYFDSALYVIGMVSHGVDPSSGLLKIHGYNVGLHQVAGENLHDGAISGYHLNDTHHGKFTVHNVIISNITNSPPNSTNTWGWGIGGYISMLHGTNAGSVSKYNIANTQFNATAEQWIAYNSDPVNTVSGIAAHNIGAISNAPSSGSYVDSRLFLLGRISATVDSNSNMLRLIGFHVGLHQHGGDNLHSSAVNDKHHVVNSIKKNKSHKHHPHRHHINGFVASVSGTTTTWTSGYCYFDDGTGLTINASSAVVNPGQYLMLGNVSAATASNPAGIVSVASAPLTSANDDQVVLGRLSTTQDSITSQYYYVAQHHGHHQSAGAHHQNQSHHRRHAHSSHHHTGHFVDTTFSIVGNTLNIKSSNGQSPKYVNDTGTQTNLIQSTLAVYAGNIVVFNTSVPSASNAFIAYGATTNLNTIPDQYLKVGHVSNAVDANTGQYVFHAYHHGSHEVHGQHIKAQSISGGISSTTDHIKAGHIAHRHANTHHGTRHHWHNIIFGCDTNCIFTCTLAEGGTGYLYDNSFNQLWSTSVGTISMGVVPGSHITMNLANQYNGYYGFTYHSGSFVLGDSEYIIGKVSDYRDHRTGRYWIQGYHQGSHQLHGNHVAPSAISSAHVVWINPVGATNIDNGASRSWIYPNTSGANNYSITAPVNISFYGMNQSVFNAIHSNGWTVGIGFSASQYQNISPYNNAYAQPLDTSYGNNENSVNVGSVPSSTMWAESTNTYGMFVESARLTPNSFGISYRLVTNNYGSLGGGGYPYVWLQIGGMQNG